LVELHEVVQAAMGWTNSHLHEFDIDGARYGLLDPDWDAGQIGDEAKTKLFRLVGLGGRLDYVYDFGDDWGHTLTVEKIAAPEPGVRCRANPGSTEPDPFRGRRRGRTAVPRWSGNPSAATGRHRDIGSPSRSQALRHGR
jgi:hypothetical protein